MHKCLSCGGDWNGSKFCPHCGRNLESFTYTAPPADPGSARAALERFEFRELPSGGYRIVGLNVLYEDAGSTELIVPDSVERIDEFALSDRKELTGLRLGKGLKTIGMGAFQNCKKIRSIAFGDSLQTIGKDAFSWCLALERLTLPDSLQTVEDRAFDHCLSLRALTFGRGVRQIGSNAFRGCEALREVTLPREARYERDAFPEGTKIKSV